MLKHYKLAQILIIQLFNCTTAYDFIKPISKFKARRPFRLVTVALYNTFHGTLQLSGLMRARKS